MGWAGPVGGWLPGRPQPYPQHQLVQTSISQISLSRQTDCLRPPLAKSSRTSHRHWTHTRRISLYFSLNLIFTFCSLTNESQSHHVMPSQQLSSPRCCCTSTPSYGIISFSIWTLRKMFPQLLPCCSGPRWFSSLHWVAVWLPIPLSTTLVWTDHCWNAT